MNASFMRKSLDSIVSKMLLKVMVYLRRIL